jgi:hypothetical protein
MVETAANEQDTRATVRAIRSYNARIKALKEEDYGR